MRLLSVLSSLAVALLLVTLLSPRQEKAMEMIPVALPTSCICFEYYYGAGSNKEPVIYQTCEVELLDQLADPNLQVYTLALPCEEVFVGTREVDSSMTEMIMVKVN